MKNKTTIKGIPVIAIYASYDDDLWIITEIRKKGRPTKAYGYVKSHFDQEGHFGEFSVSDLRSCIQKDWIYRVPKSQWHLCPEIDGFKSQDNS
jgi:hypothetical protein